MTSIEELASSVRNNLKLLKDVCIGSGIKIFDLHNVYYNHCIDII